jgi:maleylpyruvate isomerase
VEVAPASLADLTTAAVAAHRGMWKSASGTDDDACRAPSLLPGWNRGHVLTHWARTASDDLVVVSGTSSALVC